MRLLILLILFSLNGFSQKKAYKLAPKTKLNHGLYEPFHSSIHKMYSITIKKNGSVVRHEASVTGNPPILNYNEGKWIRNVPIGGFNPKYLVKLDTLILLEIKENNIIHKDTLISE